MRWSIAVLALVGGAALALLLWREPKLRTPWISDVERVERHAHLIRRAAGEARVDPNLMAGIMLAESSGLVDAVSPVGALGLFQLQLATARERAQLLRLGEPSRQELLSDAWLNTRLAAHYLAWLSKRYAGRVEPMLVAYNAGPGRLAQWEKQHGSFEAWRAEREAAGNSDILRYVKKVERYRSEFRRRGVIAPECDRPALGGAAVEARWSSHMIGPPPPDAARS